MPIHVDGKSKVDVKSKLPAAVAKCEVSRTLNRGGGLNWGAHFEKAMRDDGMVIGDVKNVLHGGKIKEQPRQDGDNAPWKYRIETPRMAVVFIFQDERTIRLVTCWRKGTYKKGAR